MKNNLKEIKKNREKKKEIIRKLKKSWGDDFPLRSKYIEDFKIPHRLIAPELTRKDFKKLWDELVAEIEKEERSI